MLTKTQLKIMQVFTSKINEKFSIKQISEILKKTYPLIHRSIQELIRSRLIVKDNKELLSLNYKENHQTLAYIESLRARIFLEKNKPSHFS
jgi:predicted transcriptional regulator